MEMEIDFVGIEDMIKAIDNLPGLLGTQVYGDGMLAAAKVVAAEAKTIVPVRTGALRDSIRARKRSAVVHTTRRRRKIAGAAAQVVAGGKNAHHAFLIEYGTVRMKAQPYLEPALRSTVSQQLAAAGAVMQKSFAKLATQITSGRATKRTLRLLAEDT